MDTQVEMADAAQGRMQLGDNAPQPARAGQQRLPAMQHDLNGAQTVFRRVLGNALRGV